MQALLLCSFDGIIQGEFTHNSPSIYAQYSWLSELATFSAEYSYFEVQYNNYWGAKVTDSALSVTDSALSVANS